MVIGTTGFTPEQTSDLKQFASFIPIVVSPNMSVGVNLLFNLVATVSRVLKDYDVEIIELHHNQKKDAPSGTAERLANIISKALNRNLNEVGIYGRKGITEKRKKKKSAYMLSAMET